MFFCLSFFFNCAYRFVFYFFSSRGWFWYCFFFFSSRRRHTRLTCDWSSDVCSSDLGREVGEAAADDEAYTDDARDRPKISVVGSIEAIVTARRWDLGAASKVSARRTEIGRASCRERV